VPVVLAIAHDLIADFDRPGFPHALNLRKRKWPTGLSIILDPVKVRSLGFSFSSAVWTIRLSKGDRLAAARAFVRHFHFPDSFTFISLCNCYVKHETADASRASKAQFVNVGRLICACSYHFVVAAWRAKGAIMKFM
jgi:hypothetical protein